MDVGDGDGLTVGVGLGDTVGVGDTVCEWVGVGIEVFDGELSADTIPQAARTRAATTRMITPTSVGMNQRDVDHFVKKDSDTSPPRFS